MGVRQTLEICVWCQRVKMEGKKIQNFKILTLRLSRNVKNDRNLSFYQWMKINIDNMEVVTLEQWQNSGFLKDQRQEWRLTN